MNKNNTVEDLAQVLLEVGTKKHGSNHGLNYCFAYGTLQAVFESCRWGHESVQSIIDRAIQSAEKDLAVL